MPQENIVLATILRAGLPLHNGMLNYFDKAQNAFIAAYRKYGKDNKFTIQIEYVSSPSIEGKTLVIADTMLATGSSLVLAYNKLCEKGEPAHTHIVCPIASEFSLGYLSKQLPHKKVTLWTAAVDEELTNKSYIVPETLVAASTLEVKVDGTKTDAAKAVGAAVAKKALENGIEKVVFDRGGNLYHGRIQALAEGAREAGLDF
jgi:uracil phosphoribosyltransferase